MRKNLLLAALYVASALGFHANAQKDVTSQYIKNATLSSQEGWTVENFNAGQKGNNTVGYASEAYAGWGSLEKTSYKLTQNITLPAGSYTLVNYSFYRQGEGATTNPDKSLAILKAGDVQVALKTLGSIKAAGYANSQVEGANCFDSKMYRNTVDFTINADDTTIEIGLEGTFDEMRSWCIAGMFELINNDIPATLDAPFDVTGYITNPGFEYRDMTGWTLEGESVIGTQGNNQFFKVGGYYAEKWQQSGALPAGSMSQTLTNLPAGYYKLTANLGGDGTYVGLNGKTVSWTADGDYLAGYVLSEGEELTITAGKTAEGTANWMHFDNFKLLFCGDIKEAYLKTIEEAKALLDNPMSSEVKANFVSVIAENEGIESGDADDYVNAINAISTASGVVNSSIALYETVRATLDAYAEKVKSLDKDGQAAYDVEDIEAAYADGSIEEDQTDAIVAAFAVATKAQTTAGADFTGAIANWDFINCSNGNFPGWTIEVSPEGAAKMKTATQVEFWTDQATRSFDYYQELTGLPVGKYVIEAAMWYSANGVADAKVDGSAGVYGISGENTVFKGVTTESDNTSLVTESTDSIIVIDGTLRLGVKNNGEMGSRWFGVDWIKLTFVEPVHAITVAEAENGKVSVSAEEGYEGDVVNLTIESAEGYELAEVTVTGASGKAVEVETDWTGAMSFTMPAEDVTVSATFLEAYFKLSNYVVATDGIIEEDGTVKAVVTFDEDVKGSYAEDETEVVFTYEVADAKGEVVVSGEQEQNPFGEINIYISDLKPEAEYTITITGVKVLDYTKFDYMDPNIDWDDPDLIYAAVVFSEEGELATATFTTKTKKKVYAIEVAETENGKVSVDPAEAVAGDVVSITAEPAEGYELAEVTVTGASGETVEVEIDEWTGAMSFTMPAEAVTVKATFQEAYVKLSNYALACDGEYDEDDAIKVVVTYDAEIVGSYAESFMLDAVFEYEVKDAEGKVADHGEKNPTPDDGVAGGIVNIYVSNLQPETEYTITITNVKITDFDMSLFDTVTVYEEEGELPSLTFKTGIPTGIANVEAAPALKADGKYLENGQIVIYRGGVKYNAAGAVIR